MNNVVNHDDLSEALRRCGSSWSAEQAHGLLCSRLSVLGVEAGADWMRLILGEPATDDDMARECALLLETLFAATHQQLAERQSEFGPLLAGDDDSAFERAAGLAHWCEGFLHGLVSDVRSDSLKERLATEPLCDIIRDLLELTRAAVDDESDEEDNEAAYTDLVEYIRVAVQLTYEELADFRVPMNGDATPHEESPPVLH